MYSRLLILYNAVSPTTRLFGLFLLCDPNMKSDASFFWAKNSYPGSDVKTVEMKMCTSRFILTIDVASSNGLITFFLYTNDIPSQRVCSYNIRKSNYTFGKALPQVS